MTISVVIHTCNESAYIDDCMKLLGWADEIVVIDMESTDDSVEKCRRYTDNIYTHERLPTADPARNFGLSKATCDWILVLDPDERVCPSLPATLRSLSDDPNAADAYQIEFASMMFGREINHSGWDGAAVVRFFRNGKVEWPGQVHCPPVVSGTSARLPRQEGYIIHDNYQSMNQFLETLNRYTSLEAQRLRELGRPFHWLKLFYQPAKEFCGRYFSGNGWRHGIIGLVLACLMAFYRQVAYLKLWEMYDRERRGLDG